MLTDVSSLEKKRTTISVVSKESTMWSRVLVVINATRVTLHGNLSFTIVYFIQRFIPGGGTELGREMGNHRLLTSITGTRPVKLLIIVQQ